LGVERHFFACSGAIVADLTEDEHRDYRDSNGDLVGGQLLHAEVSEADMVSMTMGGNDVGFKSIIMNCLLFGSNTPGSPTCASPLYHPWWMDTSSLRGIAEERIHALGAGELKVAYEAVLENAESSPGARDTPVFILGYPGVISNPLHSPCDFEMEQGFQNAELEMFEDLTEQLNLAVKCSALDAGVHFVPVNFTGFEACGFEDYDWINTAQVKNHHESFHPNAMGQRAYALSLNLYVGSKGGWPLAPPNPAPVDPVTVDPDCAVFKSRAARQSLAEFGELSVSAVSPSCETPNPQYVPGQQVRLRGNGFAGGATIDVRFTADYGEFVEDLSSINADADGALDVNVTIPALAPISGLALLEAAGNSITGVIRVLSEQLSLAPSESADADSDTVPNICDNCPDDQNVSQEDADGDGVGDPCDPCPLDREDDWDGDGVCGDQEACPLDPDNDVDSDGICGEVDNCQFRFNPRQVDSDFNGIGDACDYMFVDGFESGDADAWSLTVP
jgi:hypothetical protein